MASLACCVCSRQKLTTSELAIAVQQLLGRCARSSDTLIASLLRGGQVRRREFITLLGSTAAWPLAARAQDRVRVIGILETISPELNAGNLDALRRGLKDLGYTEGQNIRLDYRSAEGQAARFPALAADLVRLKVDLIVTRGTPAARAAKEATSTIPIVMAAIGEPIGTGVVANLAHPGRNVTGLSAVVVDLSGKRVELMKEMAPGVTRVGYLNNMSNPLNPPAWEETQTAARSLGIQAELLDVRSKDDIARAFEKAAQRSRRWTPRRY